MSVAFFLFKSGKVVILYNCEIDLWNIFSEITFEFWRFTNFQQKKQKLHTFDNNSSNAWFFHTFLDPLGPGESYIIHGSYGRNNRVGAKGLKLIDQEWSISIQMTN